MAQKQENAIASSDVRLPIQLPLLNSGSTSSLCQAAPFVEGDSNIRSAPRSTHILGRSRLISKLKRAGEQLSKVQKYILIINIYLNNCFDQIFVDIDFLIK